MLLNFNQIYEATEKMQLGLKDFQFINILC